MTTNAALKLAVAALEEQARRLAIDANMLDVHGIRTKHTVAASTLRAKFRKAIEILATEAVDVNRHPRRARRLDPAA